MLVDHLFQYRISPRPKKAEKRVFCTGVTDGRTGGRTDGRTDRPSYRDALLTNAYKKGITLCKRKCAFYGMLTKTKSQDVSIQKYRGK